MSKNSNELSRCAIALHIALDEIHERTARILWDRLLIAQHVPPFPFEEI